MTYDVRIKAGEGGRLLESKLKADLGSSIAWGFGFVFFLTGPAGEEIDPVPDPTLVAT